MHQLCERSHQHTGGESEDLRTTLDPPLVWKKLSTHWCGKWPPWNNTGCTSCVKEAINTLVGKVKTLEQHWIHHLYERSHQHTGGESDHLGTTLDAPAVWKKLSTKYWEDSDTGNTGEKKATNTPDMETLECRKKPPRTTMDTSVSTHQWQNKSSVKNTECTSGVWMVSITFGVSSAVTSISWFVDGFFKPLVCLVLFLGGLFVFNTLFWKRDH